MLEDDCPLAGLHVFLVLEGAAVSRLEPRIADDHRLEVHFLEPECDEFRDEIPSHPSPQVARLLVGQAVHHPLDEGTGQRDEAELLREDVPFDEPSDRLVHEEIHADPLAVPELPQEVVDVPLDPDRSSYAAARGQPTPPSRELARDGT